MRSGDRSKESIKERVNLIISNQKAKTKAKAKEEKTASLKEKEEKTESLKENLSILGHQDSHQVRTKEKENPLILALFVERRDITLLSVGRILMPWSQLF